MERVVHVDDERVVELCEDLPLVHHRFDAPLRDDACLGHFLHRICLLRLLTLDLPDLAEATLPDAVLVVEIGFGQRCIKVMADVIERRYAFSVIEFVTYLQRSRSQSPT